MAPLIELEDQFPEKTVVRNKGGGTPKEWLKGRTEKSIRAGGLQFEGLCSNCFNSREKIF